VVAQPDGAWWAIDVVKGLPKNRVVHTQARRINEVGTMVRDAVSLLLDVDPDSFDVAIEYRLPTTLQKSVDLFTKAEELDRVVRSETAIARSRAAAGLVAAGLTFREAGDLLGVSFQRVKQLVDRAPDASNLDPLREVTRHVNGAK
jgi:hypothetical protein